MSFVDFDGELDTQPAFEEFSGRLDGESDSLPKRAVQDTAVDLAKGVVGFGESVVGLADLATAGSVGNALQRIGYDPKQTKSFLEGFYTEDRKTANQAVSQADGFMGTLAAMGANPSTIIGSIVESLPGTIGAGAVGGAVVRRALSSAFAEAKALGLTGDALTTFMSQKATEIGAQRAAILASSIAEGAQSAGSIAEAGRQAGRDWSEYALPAAAGGAATSLINVGSTKLANKFGIGDIETDIAMRQAGAGKFASSGSFAKRVPLEAVKESVFEEMPQSWQEQVAQNIAEGRPNIFEGAGKAAAQGLVAGAGMGGGHAALTHSAPRPADILNTPNTQQAIDTFNAAVQADATASEDVRAIGALMQDYTAANRQTLEAAQAQLDAEVDQGDPLAVANPADVTNAAALARTAQADQAIAATLSDEEQGIGIPPAAADTNNLPDTSAPITGQRNLAQQVLEISRNGGPKSEAERGLMAMARRDLGEQKVAEIERLGQAPALMTRMEQKGVEHGATPPITIVPNDNGVPIIRSQTPEISTAVNAELKSAGINTHTIDGTSIRVPKAQAQVAQQIVSRVNTRFTQPRQEQTLGTQAEETVPTEQGQPESQPAAPLTLGNANHAQSATVRAMLGDQVSAEDHVGVIDNLDTLPTQVDANQGPRIGRPMAKAIKTLAGMLGRKVVFYETTNKEVAEGINRDGNTLYVNIDSNVDAVAVAGHEMVHSIEHEQPELYAKLLEATKGVIKAGGRERAVAYAKYAGVRDLDSAARELLSDIGGNEWRSGQFWSDVFDEVHRTHAPTEARSIITKIRDAVVAFINKLIRATPKQGFQHGYTREELAEIRDNLVKATAESFRRAERVRLGLAPTPEAKAGEVRFNQTRAPDISPGAGFWTKIKNNELFTWKELTDAYSIGRRGGRREGRAIREPNSGTVPGYEGARAVWRWNGVLAGESGYFSSAKALVRSNSTSRFVVSFIPEKFFVGKNFDSQSDLQDSAVLSFHFSSDDLKTWRMDVFDPEPGSEAYRRLDESGHLEHLKEATEDGEHKYVRVKLESRYTTTRLLMQEAVRRLAVLSGEVPNIVVAGRDTGARAGDRQPRGYSKDDIEAHFSVPRSSSYQYRADQLERSFEQMGLVTYRDSSRISKSEYVEVESPEYTASEGERGETLKFRVSDHEGIVAEKIRLGEWLNSLPNDAALMVSKKGRLNAVLPDGEVESFGAKPYGMANATKSIDDAKRYIREAPAPSVGPDSIGSRSLGASRNEMQERTAMRADESGSPKEPAQSGGRAGSEATIAKINPRVFVEVAPDPNNSALTEAWRSQPYDERVAMSRSIFQKILPKVLSALGIKGEFSEQLGGYKLDTNPSFATLFDNANDAHRFSLLAGYALSQDSMMVLSGQKFDGAMEAGIIQIKLPGSATQEQVHQVYLAARGTWPGKISGHTTKNGIMHIVVPRKTALQVAMKVNKALGNKYEVKYGEGYYSFPQKEDYDYASEQGILSGKLPSTREDASELRAEASRLIQSELAKRGVRFSIKRDELDRARSAVAGTTLGRQGGSERPDVDGDRTDGIGSTGSVREGSRPGAVNAIGIHYSGQQRESISSSHFGTGLSGAEEARVAQARDPRIKQRIYFYVNTGRGINPEAGVGSHAHRFELTNLYDLHADPLDIVAKYGNDLSAFESAVIDAGFNGYLSQLHGIAVLLGQRVVTPDYIGSGIKPAVPLAGRAEPSAYGKAQRTLADRHDLPSGRMKGSEWQKALPEMDLSHLDQDAYYYKDALLERPRFSAARTSAFYSQLARAVEQAPDRIFGPAQPGFLLTDAMKAKAQERMPLFSKQRMIDHPLKKWVEDIQAGVKVKDDAVVVLRHPTRPLQLGGIFRPIGMDASHVKHIINTHPEINPEDIAALPDLIGRPRAIVKNGADGWRVFLDWRDEEGKPLVAILTNYKGGGMKVTGIDTMFGQDDSAAFIARSLAADDVRYINQWEVARVRGLIDVATQPSEDLLSAHSKRPTLDRSSPTHLNSEHEVTVRSDDGPVKFVLSKSLWRKLQGVAFSKPRIIGDSGRPYTTEQKNLFKHVGREVDEKTTLEKLKSWIGKNWAQGLFDQFAPVKNLSNHAYTLMRLSKGATGAFEAFMGHGKLSIRDGAYDADTSGGVIDQVFIPLGKETTDFLYWIAGNRAERLAAEDREHLFSPDDIAAAKSLATGQTDFDYTLSNGTVTRKRALIFQDALKKFNDFSKNALDMAEQSGLIDGASRQYWEHEFYVPFYRVADEKDGGIRGMNIKQGVVRQKAFEMLNGGEEKLGDLLSNTLMNWAHLIDASAKNRAAKATIDAAVNLGAARKAVAGEKNVVWYSDKGRKAEFVVDDPGLLVALNGLEYAGLRGPAMDALSATKHWLTMGVTASPFFKVRNLIRDSIQSIAVSDLSYNPLHNVKEGWKLTNRASQEYVSALAGGGLIRFGTMLEGSEAARTRQLIKHGSKDSHILDGEGKLQAFYDKVLEPAWSKYQELGNRGEEINRMALYDKLIAEGKTHAEAALAARDLMDFSMSGAFTSVRFLTQVVPFLNARLQGLYKLGKGAKEDKARFAIVMATTALAGLAMMGYASGDDDRWKRWKKREQWDKDNYWMFSFGDVDYRIPKPFEIGAMATLVERGFETAFMLGDEKNKWSKFGYAVLKIASDQLSMNPVPQLVKPILDIYANKDSFSGRPIETMSMERLKKDYRFNAGTSMFARGASTAGNTIADVAGMEFLSPVQIDHLVRSYFGWVGAAAVASADFAIRPMTNEPSRPEKDMLKWMSGGMVTDKDSAGSRYVSHLYDQLGELESAYGTWQQLRKEGKADDAREFAADHRDELRQYRQSENVKQRLSEMNKQIRMIERSDRHPAEKRILINRIRARQSDMAERLN